MEKVNRFLVLAALLEALAVLFFQAGCSGPGGGSGSGKLSLEECRQLNKKISDVSYASLSAAERAEVESTPSEVEEAAQECVAEQPCDRDGFECAMKAASETDLKACIMGM